MAHNVKLVKEFVEPEPFLGEGWFYGQAAETKEEMVIKVLIDQGKGAVQLWVASNNLATLTGLIAEMGSVIARKMQEAMGMKEAPMPSTNEKLKEMLEMEKGRLEVFEGEGEGTA